MFEELQLDCENVKKTENDLIYVNDSLPVDKQYLDLIMEHLQTMLVEHKGRVELKEYLLDAIHDENLFKKESIYS